MSTATRAAEILPIFEDEEVNKSTLRITKAGDGLSDALDLEPQALHLGMEVSYVIRAEVKQVNHRADSEGVVTRQHTVEVTGIAAVDPKTADKILQADATRLAKLRDERTGQQRIDDDPEE